MRFDDFVKGDDPDAAAVAVVVAVVAGPVVESVLFQLVAIVVAAVVDGQDVVVNQLRRIQYRIYRSILAREAVVVVVVVVVVAAAAVTVVDVAIAIAPAVLRSNLDRTLNCLPPY